MPRSKARYREEAVPARQKKGRVFAVWREEACPAIGMRERARGKEDRRKKNDARLRARTAAHAITTENLMIWIKC